MVVLKLMGETEKVKTRVGGRLELLRDIGREASDGVDMVSVEGQVTNDSLLSFDVHKAKEGAKEGCLTAAALTGDTYQLTCLYAEVQVGEELTVAKSEGGGAEGNHQLAALNSSRKRTSFSEKRRRSLT